MGKKGIKLISMRRENKLNNNDNIKSPKHYRLEGLNIESIDVIRATLGKEGFKAFCKGNIMKYLIRAEKKNGLEDYKKAQIYLGWYLKECEEEIG
nr:MAG TPA: nucelotide kinase [Caudoviricetes sp.]